MASSQHVLVQSKRSHRAVPGQNVMNNSMNNNRESTKDNMNEKLKDYNFIQTKKFNENIDINFKKIK